jgi:hypothetical protein
MYAAKLPARAHPTALAILALARLSADAILLADLESLHQEARRDGGALALGLAALALQAAGEDAGEELAGLAAQQQRDGSWGANPYHTAVALLALPEENPQSEEKPQSESEVPFFADAFPHDSPRGEL